MSEILKQWLGERLKEPFSWEAEEFVTVMRDGTMLARLLLTYKVINEEQRLLIRPATTDRAVAANWSHLVVWLNNIDIPLGEAELKQILEGRGSALLRLFYQLFLQLDAKDRTDFIKCERKLVSNLVTKLGGRFNVEKVDEQTIPVIDYLAKPLVDEKCFLEWQKKKSEEMKQTYDYFRSQFRKTCDRLGEARVTVKRERVEKSFQFTKEKYDIDKFEKAHPCKYEDYTYEELINMEEIVMEDAGKNFIDEQWAKSYLSRLQSKFMKSKDTKEFQEQMRNVISNTLWQETIGEEEDKTDIELAEKVMKLSHFEKQMYTQLLETKQQGRNLIQNRIDTDRELTVQREHQFGQYLDNLKQQMEAELVEIDFEKQRQNVLHKKLYAEKNKRKYQHYYDICYDTMLSIVDYAVKYAYTKLLTGSKIPPHFIIEWKNMFFKQQAIFDIVENVKNILTINESEGPIEVEDIIHLELDRQNSLNENDFFAYQDASGPWNMEILIPNYCPKSLEIKQENLSLRVLGHVVYKLLEIKYPYPPERLPADLPKYTSKAILRCLPDRSMAIPMQALLNNRRISVVRVESAINYCLKSFKVEMIGCTDIDFSFDKFVAFAPESDKDLLKSMKDDEESRPIENFALIGLIPANSKQTQTPKTIPEEEIVLSTAANLGHYAYELLCGGESMTDHLISAILVEYLKTLKNIDGFVLINYPNSYLQAQILEEILTGRAPPHVEYLDKEDDIYLEKNIQRMSAKVKDIYEIVRCSKLVPDPHRKNEVKPFISYFISYIHLKETLNIVTENCVWDLYQENSEVIDRYYASQHINYSIYYEFIDKEVLAQICKYIIGDFKMPFKDEDSLFGSGVLTFLEFPSSEDKRQKTKVLKQETSKTSTTAKKRIKSSSASKLTIASNDNSTMPQYLDPTVAIQPKINQGTIHKIAILEEEVEDTAKPGEEKWQYSNLPLDHSFATMLATIWEEAERSYITDLENLFFAVRLQINSVVPYTRFARDKIDQIITRPNLKQELVSQFQQQYNDYEHDWRFPNVSKIEWHCRVKELQKALYDICDSRKKDALSERQRLIYENWTMEELTVMANTYISCMQSELNRSTLTYQLLHDFYFTLIKRPLAADRVASKDLSKIIKDSDDSPRSKRSTDDKIFAKLKMAFQEMHMKNIAIDESNNPHNFVLDSNVKLAIKIMKELNIRYQAIITKELNEVSKQATTKTKKFEEAASSDQLDEEYVKVHATKCLDEWRTAIDGEVNRLCGRLQMLLSKAHVDLKLFNDYMSRTFLKLEEEINAHYLREIESVNNLCEYIQLAIELCKRIRPTLILEQDKFVVDPELQKYPTPYPSPESTVVERPSQDEFSVVQLTRLRDGFKLVAPTGFALEPKFIYSLQDFLLYGKESCGGPLLPAAWKALEPEQMPELVFRVYGEGVCVDWRDFLIFCLNVRFPNVRELLDLRNKLRCIAKEEKELIGKDDFMKVKLWFEADFDLEDPSVALKINLMKVFLFELFESAPYTMDVSAFLLAFCKSPNPLEGFAAAVSIAVGNPVCYDLEKCETVIQERISLKKYKETLRACAIDCANRFTNTLLDNVIAHCEGITIYEVFVTPSELHIEKKKAKPKPMKGKVNQVKSTISTQRITKQKSIPHVSSPDAKNMVEPGQNSQEEFDEVMEEKESKTNGEKSTIKDSEQEPVVPACIYSVSPQVIKNILNVCLPWQFKSEITEKKMPYVEPIAEILERLGRDTENGEVYVAKFLNEEVVCKMLHKIKKFYVVKLLDIAKHIMFKEKDSC